jgi:uncharacterized Ntn-hydrolase superfamily protein
MKYAIICLVYLLCITGSIAQDTFSIVAVDSISGEVGSAGASCLDNNQFPGSNGAIIISNVIPGRGALHTQAQWNQANQIKARQQLLAGKSPQEVITFMSAGINDANFNPAIRQYGIADLSPQGQPRAAAFTGANCFDYKNHIVGPNYAIQGNILSGQAILDSMEARFLQTQGPLADRLMAALQGANVPGADTRCLANGTSSLSAFIRVAKPADQSNAFYLDLNVPSLPTGREPIDSLQTLFDRWKQVLDVKPDAEILEKYLVSPNPGNGHFRLNGPIQKLDLRVYTAQLQELLHVEIDQQVIDLSHLPKGMLVLVLAEKNGKRHVHRVVHE